MGCGTGCPHIILTFIFQAVKGVAHVGCIVFMAGGSCRGFIIVIEKKLKILQRFLFFLEIEKIDFRVGRMDNRIIRYVFIRA